MTIGYRRLRRPCGSALALGGVVLAPVLPAGPAGGQERREQGYDFQNLHALADGVTVDFNLEGFLPIEDLVGPLVDHRRVALRRRSIRLAGRPPRPGRPDPHAAGHAVGPCSASRGCPTTRRRPAPTTRATPVDDVQIVARRQPRCRPPPRRGRRHGVVGLSPTSATRSTPSACSRRSASARSAPPPAPPRSTQTTPRGRGHHRR